MLMKMQNIIMQIEMLEVIPCCGLQINNALSNNEIPALDFVFPAIFFLFSVVIIKFSLKSLRDKKGWLSCKKKSY
jgi:hypothetical protein